MPSKTDGPKAEFTESRQGRERWKGDYLATVQ